MRFLCWCTVPDLNREHLAYKASALTIELTVHNEHGGPCTARIVGNRTHSAIHQTVFIRSAVS